MLACGPVCACLEAISSQALGGFMFVALRQKAGIWLPREQRLPHHGYLTVLPRMLSSAHWHLLSPLLLSSGHCCVSAFLFAVGRAGGRGMSPRRAGSGSQHDPFLWGNLPGLLHNLRFLEAAEFPGGILRSCLCFPNWAKQLLWS